MAKMKPTNAEKEARAKKRAMRRAARAKIVRVERELTSGDLDTRKDRVREALSEPPLVKRPPSAPDEMP